MGTFFHSIRLIGPSGVTETLEALVDTGSTFTTVPRSVLERLGVQPHRMTRPRLANGEVVEWPWGWVTAEIDGVREQTPCVFGAEAAPPVIGAVTLEILGLGVDPREERLVPREGFLMSMDCTV